MLIVIVVLVVVAVVAYLKVPAVKAKVDGILYKSKVEGTPAPSITVPAQPYAEFKGFPFEDVMRILQQRGSWSFADEEIAKMKAAGVVFRDVQEAGPGVDRSGYDITYLKGWTITNVMENGRPYTVTLGKPGNIRVEGYSGNTIKRVNGKDCDVNSCDIPNQSGSVTLTVESNASDPAQRWVAVHLR